MNREQIVKALECCTSPEKDCNCPFSCPYGDITGTCCIQALMAHALSLIREMEIELEAMRTAANSLKMHYEKANELDGIKADTVRRMQEMIKERCIKGGIYPVFVARVIDQIAKEILDGHGTPPDTCASCGEVIPEGRQVCPNCYATEKSKNKKGR